jgi:hypothetical protein
MREIYAIYFLWSRDGTLAFAAEIAYLRTIQIFLVPGTNIEITLDGTCKYGGSQEGPDTVGIFPIMTELGIGG